MSAGPRRVRRRATKRRRPYRTLFNAHDTNTANLRETIARPAKGKRIRALRIRAIQEYAEGRYLYEVYFGLGATIDDAPGKAVDTLDIPEGGEASTRVFLKDEGPRGQRDEVLSGRWSGAAPYIPHKILVEYTEES